MEIPVGAHVPNAHPLKEAEARGADLAQVFLSSPKSWRKPAPRQDAERLRTSGLPLYVHAPYLVNVASPNNRVRIPSRKILVQTCQGAAAIGAAGVVVHGGFVGDDEEPEAGFVRWRKALDEVADLPVRILIENTAGGGNALARRLDVLGRLWEEIGDTGVGFCLDTCHAWAAGEDLETIVERVGAALGGIGLVHCNDSRDPAGSGRDRHEHLGGGRIPPELLTEVVGRAGAPVIVETRGEAEDHARDIAWLRRRLGPE